MLLELTLPVNGEEKKWIEESFQWLLETFGKDVFLKHKTILPEEAFFPDKFDGSEEAVDKMVNRVCSYMDVDPRLIEVEFFFQQDESKAEHGQLGLYYAKTSAENRKKIALNVGRNSRVKKV